MSEIKLKRSNSKKVCPKCNELVKVVMEGKDGFCPDCKGKIYTIDVRELKKIK